MDEQVAQVVRDALAEGEVDPVRMVEHHPHALGRDLLREHHLDVGLGRPETGLDLGLYVAHFSHPGEKKVGCEAHLQVRPPGAADESPSAAEYSFQTSTIRVTGPSFTSATAMRAPKRPPRAPRPSRTSS